MHAFRQSSYTEYEGLCHGNDPAKPPDQIPEGVQTPVTHLMDAVSVINMVKGKVLPAPWTLISDLSAAQPYNTCRVVQKNRTVFESE